MDILKAPAKVNLGLWVLSKLPDGYHQIFTLVHKVSLYDRIFIKPAPFLSVKTTNPKVPENEENIVYKAVKAFEGFTGIEANFEILIEKNIPVGGGLGGGSSDAATVLKYLNEYFGKPISDEDLIALAASIGSDVAAFLKEGLVKVEGTGDKVSETGCKFDEELFIVYPNEESSTSEMYKAVTSELLTKPEEIPIIDNLLGDVKTLLESVENTLGAIAAEKLPVVKEVVNTLEYLGYKPYITGSGSSVFAIGQPSQQLENVCKTKGWALYKVRFI